MWTDLIEKREQKFFLFIKQNLKELSLVSEKTGNKDIEGIYSAIYQAYLAGKHSLDFFVKKIHEEPKKDATQQDVSQWYIDKATLCVYPPSYIFKRELLKQEAFLLKVLQNKVKEGKIDPKTVEAFLSIIVTFDINKMSHSEHKGFKQTIFEKAAPFAAGALTMYLAHDKVKELLP